MPDNHPITPEILVSRLGDYLVDKKIITAEDLQQALNSQDEFNAVGKTPPLLGQILINSGIISQETLDSAITEQILALRNALLETNRNLEEKVKARTFELAQALEKLSELDRLKSNFVANISHELRTPLTHLKVYIELLTSKMLGSLNNEQEHAVNKMETSYLRLEKLIEDLILFSISDRGAIDLYKTITDTTKLLDDIAVVYKLKCEQNNLLFGYIHDDKLPMINVDTEKISWTIKELLDNAIKFSKSEGKVTLKAVNEHSFVKITVKDTGIGIPDYKINDIFKAFQQLDDGRNRKYSGTGLGLALADRILQAHSSKIELISKIDDGCEFSFLLPAIYES